MIYYYRRPFKKSFYEILFHMIFFCPFRFNQNVNNRKYNIVVWNTRHEVSNVLVRVKQPCDWRDKKESVWKCKHSTTCDFPKVVKYKKMYSKHRRKRKWSYKILLITLSIGKCRCFISKSIMFIYKHIPRLHTYYIELQTKAAFFFYIFIHKCDKSSFSKGILVLQFIKTSFTSKTHS